MNGTVTRFAADGVSGEPETNQPAGVEQDTTNQPKPSDEELTKRIESLSKEFGDFKIEAQTSLDRQKSTLQSTHAAELGNLKQTWEGERDSLVQDVRALTLENLDEDARASYEQRFADEDYRKMEDRVREAEAQANANAQVGPYLQGAAGLGLDVSKFDLNDPSGSLWRGVTGLIDDLKGEVERLKTQEPEVKPEVQPATTTGEVEPTTIEAFRAPIEPSPVLTTQHSTPAGKDTLGAVRQALSKSLGREVSLDEVFNLAEQRPDLEQRLRELSQQGSE